MATLLYGNISEKTASYTVEPGRITLPTVVAGDNFRLAVRLTESNDGVTTVTRPTITSARLSYGPVDVAPSSGTFKMVVGGVTSGVVTIGSSAASVAAVLNAMATPATGWSVILDRESYLVSRTANWTATSGITIVENLLEPESFVRVTSFSRGSNFVQELRPMQSPLAYTSAFALIVPQPPSITRVVSGYRDEATGVSINEVQRLYVPQAFDGSYQIYRGTARTRLLSQQDSVDDIRQALNTSAVTPGAGEVFLVTNPQNNVAHIEFAGEMGGLAQDLLTVQVPISLQGDVTFDLDTNTAAMQAAFRDQFEVTHPLTCEIGINYGTVATPDVRYVTVFQQNMTMQADGAWSGLAAAQRINWLNPPQPVNYIPFTTDQVITGIQSYTAVVTGTGPWTVAHNLGTEAIHVTVRENISNGYLLGNENDYTVQTATSQSVVVTKVAGTVPTSGWAVMISSAGPTSAFLAHTHTIEQVVSLSDTLNSLGQRLISLEGVLPNNTGIIAGQSTLEKSALTIKVTGRQAVLFAGHVKDAWTEKGINTQVLPTRGPSLLRSFSGLPENASSAAVPTAAGAYIYSNGVDLAPMGYIPARSVPPGGTVVYDEGRIYEARQDGTNKTYFPVPYEVELFKIPVNSYQLRVGWTMEVRFGVVLQMLAETEGQWRVVVDAANLAGVVSPELQGLNISSADYNQNKLIDHRVMLTEALTPHVFGVQILRRLVDGQVTVTANKSLYGTYESAIGAPASADFLLRARLINFDVADTGGDPRGWVGYRLGGVENNEISEQVLVNFS